MDKVEKISIELQEFSEAELAAFRKWFHEFDAEQWDRQIADDAAAGKLDALAEKSLQDFKSGRCEEI